MRAKRWSALALRLGGRTAAALIFSGLAASAGPWGAAYGTPLLNAGLAALIAAPILSSAALAAAYAAEGERRLAAAALSLLAMIGLGLVFK